MASAMSMRVSLTARSSASGRAGRRARVGARRAGARACSAAGAMPGDESPYAVLGLSDDADFDTVKRVYNMSKRGAEVRRCSCVKFGASWGVDGRRAAHARHSPGVARCPMRTPRRPGARARALRRIR